MRPDDPEVRNIERVNKSQDIHRDNQGHQRSYGPHRLLEVARTIEVYDKKQQVVHQEPFDRQEALRQTTTILSPETGETQRQGRHHHKTQEQSKRAADFPRHPVSRDRAV